MFHRPLLRANHRYFVSGLNHSPQLILLSRGRFHNSVKHAAISTHKREFGIGKTSRVFVPSQAQVDIVKACKTHNVMVSARPGSGKTATAEAVVQANPSTRISIVTYSKRLQLDTERRLRQYSNVDVFTFHGLASKLFGEVVHNDAILRDLRVHRIVPTWMPNYEMVIFDEMQDLTENLYWLTRVLIAVLNQIMPEQPRLLVLGDPRQAIFQFRGADARYLALVDDIYSDISPHQWQYMKLDKSFRLSHQTAAFVNGFIGEEYIEGSHDGPKSIYLHADIWDQKTLLHDLLPHIRKYKPENTVILAPHVRNSHSIAQFTNALSKIGIKVAAPVSDDAPLDDDVLNGKVVVSTYHQFKGCERDLVIVYGVDDSFFQTFARDLHDDRCPNATFVALTRARKQLIVIQEKGRAAMPFMSWETMERNADFVNLANDEPVPQTPPGRPLQLGLNLPRNISVTDICRHLDEEKLHTLVHKYVQIRKVTKPFADEMCIKADPKVLTNEAKQHYEIVSDLSGLAVTAAFEWQRAGTCTTFGYPYRRWLGKPDVPQDPKQRARWFAREAMEYDARQSLYKSRSIQMKGHSFDWLDNHLDVTTKRLGQQFENMSRLRFEQSFNLPFEIQEPADLLRPCHDTKIRGRVDIVDVNAASSGSSKIWEIKFVSSLSLEHVAQVAIYGYMWLMKKPLKNRKKFPALTLFNIQDGEKWEIDANQEGVAKLIEELLRAKYTSSGELNTPVFIDKCRRTSKEVDLAMQNWKKVRVRAEGKDPKKVNRPSRITGIKPKSKRKGKGKKAKAKRDGT